MTAAYTPLTDAGLALLTKDGWAQAAAEIRALRASEARLLEVVRMVSAQYEHEQRQVAAGNAECDDRTWLTVDHTVGQKARAAIAAAEGRAEG